MCELFAMSSRFPATVRYSLEEFSRHGGLAGPHKDGWGIAYYADGDVRLFKETRAASDSACLRFIQEHPFSSTLVLSHIRKATQGGQAPRNCQPFVRELGGVMHAFAHNGDLDRRALPGRLPLGMHRPDGDSLFAHGHGRTHEGAGIKPPGLHMLSRKCPHADGSFDAGGLSILSRAVEQEVVLVASVPLTSEPGWRPLDEGELLAVRAGGVVARQFAADPPRRELAVAAVPP